MKPKNYYKENELEFLMLFRQFKQKIEDGSIMNDENAAQFIDVLQSMVNSLNDIVRLRRETDEMENLQVSSHDEHIGNCPVCLMVQDVLVIGEHETGEGYHVNVLECCHCGAIFDDHLPNSNEELIRWYENFFNQLPHTVTDEGYQASRLDIPSEELESLQEVYEELLKSRDSIKASKLRLQQIEKTSDQQVKEVTRYLYTIYGQVVSGEHQIKLN